MKGREKIWILGYLYCFDKDCTTKIVGISLLLSRKLNLDKRILPKEDVDYVIDAIKDTYKYLNIFGNNPLQDMIVIRDGEEILIRPTKTVGDWYFIIYRNVKNFTIAQHSFEEDIRITITM